MWLKQDEVCQEDSINSLGLSWQALTLPKRRGKNVQRKGEVEGVVHPGFEGLKVVSVCEVEGSKKVTAPRSHGKCINIKNMSIF